MKNDKSIYVVFEYMFIDTVKIMGWCKKSPINTNTIFVDIDSARGIFERLLSQRWIKNEKIGLRTGVGLDRKKSLIKIVWNQMSWIFIKIDSGSKI